MRTTAKPSRVTLCAATVSLLLAVTALCALRAAAVERSVDGPRLNIERIQDVAGTSPYEKLKCNVFVPDEMEGGGREGEPMIAVNPRFPRNRIAV